MSHKSRKLLKPLVPVLIALAIPVLFICCTPKWLPDSSGFVYVNQGRVMLYDLKTKSSKELVKTNSPMASVAVWPTGDRVAVATLVPNGDKQAIQFSIYDLEGKEKHKSPSLDLTLKDDKYMLPPQTYASHDGKHIVTFVPNTALAVVYTIDGRSFRQVENVLLPSLLFFREFLVTDVSPVTPDGKGFLAAVGEPGAPTTLGFCSWTEGKPQPFEVSEEAKTVIGDKLDGESGIFPSSRWEMGMLVTRTKSGLAMANPRERTISLVEDERTTKLLEHAAADKVFVLLDLPDGSVVQFQQEQKEFQIWKRDAPAKAIMTMKEDTIFFLSASPDGNRILVRKMGEEDHITVVDKKGDVLADIKNPSVIGR